MHSVRPSELRTDNLRSFYKAEIQKKEIFKLLALNLVYLYWMNYCKSRPNLSHRIKFAKTSRSDVFGYRHNAGQFDPVMRVLHASA